MSHIIAGVLYNIPEHAYGETIVSKTYSKLVVDGTEYIVYGEPVCANVYEIALYYNGEDLSEEAMKEIQNIIDKATDMSPDLGFDAGVLYE